MKDSETNRNLDIRKKSEGGRGKEMRFLPEAADDMSLNSRGRYGTTVVEAQFFCDVSGFWF